VAWEVSVELQAEVSMEPAAAVSAPMAAARVAVVRAAFQLVAVVAERAEAGASLPAWLGWQRVEPALVPVLPSVAEGTAALLPSTA
jgi:hypothetical protein